MNTITHCTIFKAFLFCRHLCWGKEETQIGKVKEERKTPLFKVLSYLGNTAQALLLITPDRCYINPGKRNYSITILFHLRDSQILLYYLQTGVSHPYPLIETDILVGDVIVGESLDITFSSRYPSSQQERQEKPKAR